MMAALRSGDWLTPERLRVYPLMLLAFAFVAVAFVIAASQGGVGPNNLPLGADFSQVWVAGKEALAGHPEAPFDIRLHAAAQRSHFGPEKGIFGWHYPPYFLAPAAILARLPYLEALTLWQCATLALYLVSILAILRGSGLTPASIAVAALAYPAVIVNLGHGQNGFLTAALLGGGFVLLDRRPLLAGGLFALLAYKPQFGLTLPLALLIGGHWRALAAGAATLAAMTAASLAAFGLASWRAFFDSLGFTRAIVEEGATGFEKIQSVFAAVRLMGGGVPAAYAAQTLAAAVALSLLLPLLRSRVDARIKAAGVIAALFLTTPYSLDYDMMALAPALALLLAHGLESGFRPYEKSALAVAYVAPLLARPVASVLPLPLGAAAIILLFLSTARYSFPLIDHGDGPTAPAVGADARQSIVDNCKGRLCRFLTLISPKVNFL
ncbi:MAG: glycosyltransferase family 87 protein [Methylocystis sp.]|uniref:glycosyltransferase family 87 protein n=1 Tax=Methylocystis sp. TaxID=1911079 RepID=UPI003DA51E00